MRLSARDLVPPRRPVPTVLRAWSSWDAWSEVLMYVNRPENWPQGWSYSPQELFNAELTRCSRRSAHLFQSPRDAPPSRGRARRAPGPMEVLRRYFSAESVTKAPAPGPEALPHVLLPGRRLGTSSDRHHHAPSPALAGHHRGRLMGRNAVTFLSCAKHPYLDALAAGSGRARRTCQGGAVPPRGHGYHVES